MSDGWLDRGHGDGQELTPLRAAAPADLGDVGGRARSWTSWLGSPLAIVVVAGAVLIGSVGTAYAIRETLFPSIGASTARSVWQNPAPADPPTPPTPTPLPPTLGRTTSAVSTTLTTTMPTTTMPTATMPTTTMTSVAVADEAPSVTASNNPPSTASAVPTVTIDDRDDRDDRNEPDEPDEPDDSDRSGSGSGNSGSGNSGSGSDELDD